MRHLAFLACGIFCVCAVACFVPKYEKYFEPSAEGARLATTYCADNRYGPPALAEFVVQSTPITVYAYRKPEDPRAIVIAISSRLKDGQTLSFDPGGVKVVDLATNQKLAVEPDHWSKPFLGASETHALDGPLNIVGHPRFKGGLDRVAVFVTLTPDGTEHFKAEFPGFVIDGSASAIPPITFTEKSGVFALPVFGNC